MADSPFGYELRDLTVSGSNWRTEASAQLLIDGQKMALKANGGRWLTVQDPKHAHCPSLAAMMLKMGGKSDPYVVCHPTEGDQSYMITHRCADEYMEMFDGLDAALTAGKRVWEPGPGLSSFPQEVLRRECEYTAFDSAPYELIGIMAQCALRDDLEEVLCLRDSGRTHMPEFWLKRCQEMIEGRIKLIRGLFPDSLKQVMSEPAPDVIVEYNGPSVSLIDKQRTEAIRQQHGSAPDVLLRHCGEVREYVSTLLHRLAPQGTLFYQLGLRREDGLHLEVTKEEGLLLMESADY